ncbi:hypothetical protein Tco_1034453 [Tanacetum coccineum]
MKNQSDVQNYLVEIQADDHDLLVNSDNENDDMLGYEFEKYSNDEDVDGTNHAKDADGTNHSDLKLVKRGITRLYKFRMEYGKPGDLVREHIGLKILSWKKVDKESRDKLWDEITRYFDVDLTVKKLVMHRLGKLLRNFRMKLREKYILPNLNTPSKLNELPAKYSAIVKAEEWVEFVNYTTTDAYKIENKEIKADEEPLRGIMWLKGKVNKDEEFTDDKIRSVGDKLKEADDKIREGTLNLDDGTDAMTVVFGKEKGGYARGVGSGVTYKRYFHLPRSRQVTDESVGCTRGAVEFVISIASSLRHETQSSVVVRDKDARIQKKSNGLVITSEKEPVKTVGPKKMPKSQRNRSQDSQSQGNASKCKLWHLKKSNIVALGTVCMSAGKQMLHNQALPNDCYKVSIDSSLVDAACIPDVGNNGLKTVKDGVGGFFAWPKNQVVLDEEVTPPTSIQKISDYNSAPKLQSKRKNYVSHETMQRQARTGKSHKSLNYGS